MASHGRHNSPASALSDVGIPETPRATREETNGMGGLLRKQTCAHRDRCISSGSTERAMSPFDEALGEETPERLPVEADHADSLDAALRHIGEIGTNLSKCGLNVYSVDEYGWTALHTAVLHQQEDAVRLLVETLGVSDIPTPHRMYHRRTPSGRLQTVCSGGVHASALRPSLWRRVTGQEAAAATGDLCHVLRDFVTGMGADNGTMQSEEVLCASLCSSVERFGSGLLHAADADQRFIGGYFFMQWTILAAAAHAGYATLCRICLDMGAMANQCLKNGTTPLHAACWNGHADCARLLLEYGAEVDQADRAGLTPLHFACQNGYADCVRACLDRGAMAHREATAVMPPLFIACQNGDECIVRLCLEHGAAVNQAWFHGRTPLHGACLQRNRAMTALLLEYGADPTRVDHNGETPVDLARAGAMFGGMDAALLQAVERATEDPEGAVAHLRALEGPIAAPQLPASSEDAPGCAIQ